MLFRSVSARGGAVSATMNTLKANLDESMKLFFDMLRNPGYDQARLDIMRGQAVEGMKQRNDDAAQILGREWRYLMYGDEHFESQQATKDGWDAITPERLKAQHDLIVHPGNVIISVTGDFDPDDMMKRLAAGMAGWKAGDKGSVLYPPEYMKLAGPWINGQDPADSPTAKVDGQSAGGGK